MQPVSSLPRPSTRPAPAPRPGIRPQPLGSLWWLVIIIALVSTPIAWAEPPAAPASPAAIDGVRISQVYGGGGMTGAPYRNDFVELFNAGTTTVDLTGWSIQYGAALGNTWTMTSLSGSIPPGGYYLISQGASNGCGGQLCGEWLPQANISGQINLGAPAGKLMLVSSTADHAGQCPSDPDIVDLVGYGANANCYEGSPAPTASNTLSVVRGDGGCTDTGDNGSDFSTAAPAPRNASTPPRSCAPLAAELSVFSAEVQGSDILLAWETVSETDNAGFNIYRGEAESGSWRKANAALIPAAAPGSSSGHSYRWTDTGLLTAPSYWYMLEAVDLDGSATRYGPVAVQVSTPNAVTLATARATSRPGTAVVICGALGLAAGWSIIWRARRRRRR